jgi:hypothetical protein
MVKHASFLINGSNENLRLPTEPYSNTTWSMPSVCGSLPPSPEGDALDNTGRGRCEGVLIGTHHQPHPAVCQVGRSLQ